MANGLSGIASFGTSFLDAFNKASDRELLQAIRSGTLDVQQRTIALAELKNRQQQERQEGLTSGFSSLSEALSDQLGLTSQPTQDISPQAQDVSSQAQDVSPQRTVRTPQFQRSADSITKINNSLGRLQALDPTGEAADFGFKMLELNNTRILAAEKRSTERNVRESFSLLKIKDPEAQARAIQQTIADRAKDGLPSPALERILALPLERREVGLQRRKIMNTDFKLLMESQEKELERQSKEGIEAAKLAAKPVQETFTDVLDTAGNIIGQKSSLTGRIVADPRTPKPATKTSLEKNLDAAGITDPEERKKIIVESITKPGTQININEGLKGIKLPKDFMFDKDETGKTIGIKPIPGGKADRLGAGDAAKVQMLRTAQKAAKGIRELIFKKFDKKGAGTELNSTNLFNAQFNTPFTDGRKLRNKMEFGIQGITRGETGAAMPPAEVDNTRTRFTPNIFDTPEIARLKLEMFDDFLSGTLQLIDPSGRFNEDRFGNTVKPTFDKSGNAIELGELNEAKFDEELQRRISGEGEPRTQPSFTIKRVR